jgi:uncharacterized protein (TIGR03437 family)
MGSGFAGDASVLVNGRPAAVLYANDGQINAAIPDGVGQSGIAYVEVATPIGKAGLEVSLAPMSPGIFTQNSSGTGQGAVLNQDLSVNSPENPAAPGSVIAVYLTGIGQMDAQVTGEIGQLEADVLYAGPAPGFISAVRQVNLRVPPNTPPGDKLSVVVAVGPARSQPGVTVSVR